MANSMKNGRPVNRVPRRSLLIAGLAAFFIVDIILVSIALTAGDVPTPRVLRSPAPISSADPTAAPAEPPKPAAATATAPARIMAAVDGNRAWRASTGPCGAEARPEFSADGGATWKSTDATAPTGVVSLQAIDIEGEQVASMIGQNAVDCSAMLVRTFVGGDNYARYPADLPNAWYVNPLDRAVVHAPGGDGAAPCAEAIALAAASAERAAVLCGDGAMFATTDSAANWSAIAATPGAMALAASGAGYVVAVIGDATCGGVRLGFFTDATSPAPVVPGGCFASESSAAALAGQIAVADGGGILWLWAGASLARSSDGGATWQ
jgi:photosystem II stability/assembly factor-like uncharacterized protein